MAAEVKKKIRPGAIECHPEELALVVTYEVQEVVTHPDGSQEVQSSTAATKKISIKSLNDKTDLPLLAGEIVDKCKLIHPSKVGTVQDLLQLLLQRDQQQSSPATASDRSATTSTPPKQQQQQQSDMQQRLSSPASSSARSPKTHSPTQDPSQRPDELGTSPPSAASQRHTTTPPATASPTPSTGSSRLGGGRSRQQQQQQQQSPQPEDVGEQKQKAIVQASQIFEAVSKSLPPAFIDELDDYVEQLYEEDLSKKVTATGMIAQLFRDAGQIEALVAYESLLPTLARVLREDGKRSLELATNLVSAFYCCSALRQLHALISDNQVGALTLELIDLEIKRSEIRVTEEGPSAAPAAIAARAAAARQGQAAPLTDREKKLAALLQRQDRFLYIATALLLNLAEDTAVEKKMKKKNVVVLLVRLLDRPHMELISLCINFLRKLSIYQENKERMATCGLVPRLSALLLPSNATASEGLQAAVLRLLHNLSFDATMRQQMVSAGLVPKVVDYISVPRLSPLALGLLYHMSMEESAKSMFAYTDALPRVHEMLLRSADLRSTPELIALAVNLAHSKRVAEWFCEGDRIDRLIRKASNGRDELSFKLLRNLTASGSQAVATKLLGYIEPMVAILQSAATGPELFVEVLGTLASTCDAVPAGSNGAFDWSNILSRCDIVGLLQAYLAPGALEDDAALEAVVLVGAVCGDAAVAPAVAASEVLPALMSLMTDKRQDDEFVLQVLWAFNKALTQPSTRDVMLRDSQVILYMVDLLQDSNAVIRQTSDACLDSIMDADEEWAIRIRNLKFELYNQQWLQMIRGHDAGHGNPMMNTTVRAGATSPVRQQLSDAEYEEDDDEDHGQNGMIDYNGFKDGHMYAGGQHMVVNFDDYAADDEGSPVPSPNSWGAEGESMQGGGMAGTLYGNHESYDRGATPGAGSVWGSAAYDGSGGEDGSGFGGGQQQQQQQQYMAADESYDDDEMAHNSMY